MKKIATKKHLSFLLLFAMLITLAVPAARVNAGGEEAPLPKKLTLYCYKDSSFNTSEWYYVAKPIVSVKSSKSSVVAVTGSAGYNFVNFTIKKAGTSNITVKAKGKTYKCKITVLKYKNPYKKIKIGSKNYKTSYNKTAFVGAPADQVTALTTKKATVNIKLNKGFSNLKIKLTHFNYTSGKTTKKTVKNGSKVKFQSGDSLQITMKDKRSGKTMLSTFYLQ